MPHYTVVEVKRKRALGRGISPQDLQQAINEHAHKGLVLDRIVSGETARHLVGVKDVFLVIFGRSTRSWHRSHRDQGTPFSTWLDRCLRPRNISQRGQHTQEREPNHHGRRP